MPGACGRSRGRFARAISALLVVFSGLTVVLTSTTTAEADTPYTFMHENFSGTQFPPTNWTATSGTWTKSCTPPPASPAAGCSAVATVSDDQPGTSQFIFDPGSGIPSTLQNPTLNFYSNFDPGPTSAGDTWGVWTAHFQGQLGDLDSQINLTTIDNTSPGVQVAHSVPLTSRVLPLVFRWTTFGDSNPTAHKTWSISDVSISGTIAGATYTLTADPIPNTTYPNVKGGQPVTLTLSGSSSPTGDALSFGVVSAPTVGTLGTITSIDDTHAHVTYTPNACPDPNGTANFLCVESFTYKATDLSGNESSPAQVVIDVHPEGAGATTVTVDAPSAVSYQTIVDSGTPTQAADLSSLVTTGPSGFPDAIELKLQVPTGEIRLPMLGVAGVSLLDGTSSPGAQIHISGSVSHINTAISQLLYFPPAGTTPTTTLSLSTTDLGPTGSGPFTQGASTTVTISPVVVVPRPSIALPTGALKVVAGVAPLTFPSGAATGITVTDGGASSSTLDTVLLSVSAGALALPPADTSGANPLVTATAGTGTLDITGTVTNLNTALSHLTFDATGLGSSTVTLTASVQDPDTVLASTLQQVSIAVTAPPSAFGTSTVTVRADIPTTVFLCGSGPAGDTLGFTITSGPTHGTFVEDPSANTAGSGCSSGASKLIKGYTYTSSSGYSGADSVSYTVDDITTGISSVVNAIAITVQAHTTPTADPASVSTRQDEPVTVTVCGYNPDPAPALSFVIQQQPSHGTVTDGGAPSVNPCNSVGQTAHQWIYSPAGGAFTSDGTDSFTYMTSNGAFSTPATVTINVATRTPQVVARMLTVDENSSIGFFLCSTLPNGNATFVLTDPAHGVLDTMTAATNDAACPSGYSSSYRRYSPTFLYSGPDSFTYTATSGTYTSAPATISFTVNKVEIPPTVDAQSLTVVAGKPTPITLTGTSLQGSTLTYRVVNQPTKGQLTGTAPALFYTSTGSGTDSFTYVANDGVADSPPATVSITIVKPRLSSSVCLPGVLPIGLDHYSCAGSLTPVSDGSGGSVWLAHTDGTRTGRLDLQVTVTNESGLSDRVTLTATDLGTPWGSRYAIDGSDVTAAITGSGYDVTLAPGASVYVHVLAFPPLVLPSALTDMTAHLTVNAVSGNDSGISTAVPIWIQDGTSAPRMTLTQQDGTGTVQAPNALYVPPLIVGGGTRTAFIVPTLVGTGDNPFTLRATVQGGSVDGSVRYFFGSGSTEITSAVVAGTQVIQCYEGPSQTCPRIRAEFSPGTTAGQLSVLVRMTSLINGDNSDAVLNVPETLHVGPNLSTNLPNVGLDEHEATPVVQVVSKPVQAPGGTASKTLFLTNSAEVPDTFLFTDVRGSTDDTKSSLAITGFPVGTVVLGGGRYSITLGAGEGAQMTVTDTAGPTAGLTPLSAVFTVTSGLDPTKVDSFQMSFPTYSFRPKITAPVSTLSVDQTAHTMQLSLLENNVGQAPVGDTVVLRAPASDASFELAYGLITPTGTRDVTADVTGAGLTTTLVPNGAPAQRLVVTARATVAARLGAVRAITASVTSASSLPTGLKDQVSITLLNAGDSELQFIGLPQDEPDDIRAEVAATKQTGRVAPIAGGTYVPGKAYGDYSDPTGNKFVYASGLDRFTLRLAANSVFAAPYKIKVSSPGTGLGLPLWVRYAFGASFYNNHVIDHPADPLGASGINPTFTSGGQDVTAALLAGTFTTAELHPGQTVDLATTFAPPANDSRRYTPLKVELINATSGHVEDVFLIGLSTILQCSSDSTDQILASTRTSTGQLRKLAFHAYNRSAPGESSCMQHLSTGWVTRQPVVFSSYTPAVGDIPAGGYEPNGYWLVPQLGATITIDAATLDVTSALAKSYVDVQRTDPDTGEPLAGNLLNYTFAGTYTNLIWHTTDHTNGLKITEGVLPTAPFPLIAPESTYWPSNTMDAARYMQVDVTGTPVMVGEIAVNTPWYKAHVPLVMPVDNETGADLTFRAPENVVAHLPGDDSVSSWGLFWNTRKDGVVEQGGCLGVPPAFYALLGLNKSTCIIGVKTVYRPIPSDPDQEASIANIDVLLKVVGTTIGTPEFNLKSLAGTIDLEPGTSRLQKLVLDANFGVGPPTPCQLEKTARKASGASTTLAQDLQDKLCPSNYFGFDAKVTFQQGGFTSANSTTGYGIKFDGTLSLLNVINLSHVEADISTSPFNFHFEDSPVAVSIDVGVPLSATISLAGDIGALGFDIALSGQVTVWGQSIASASGIISTKGVGLCGGLAGVSVGFGDVWGESPVFYPSGCTTDQYRVTT